MEANQADSKQVLLAQIPNFFLDNNIFWVLAGDQTGDKVANWNRGLIDRGICPTPRPVHHAVTAFSFLESIKGQNKIPPLEKELLVTGIVDVESYKVFAFEKAKAHFSSISWLQAEKLRVASRKLKEPLPKLGRDLYELVIEHNLNNDDFAKWLWNSLAYDFVTNLSAPPHIGRDVWDASFYVDLVRGPAHGHNFSLARATVRHFIRIKQEIDLSRRRKKEFLSNIRLKSTGDHLDGDLVTFAVGGLLHEERMEPVICFTADANVQRTKDRIFAQKSLLNAAHSRMAEMGLESKLPFSPLKPQYGHVFICDYQGRIKDQIDVSTIDRID